MGDLYAKLIDYVPTLSGLALLAYGLSQARRTTNDIVNHIDKFGNDFKGKRITMSKVILNFYLVLAAIMIFAMRLCAYIENQTFLVLEFGVLIALCAKLTWEAVHQSSSD